MKQFGTILAVILAISSAGSAVKQPRFAPPSEYSSGYVSVAEYLMMSDPKEAAKALLHDSAIAQVDIDKLGATEPHREIRLPGGEIMPPDNDDSFLRLADAEIAAGRADEDTVCLVKTARVPSIRELADIMSSGVHVYKDVQFYTYISRVPFSVARNLRKNPLVEWIGFQTPRSKVLGGTTFMPDLPISVHSLDPDNEKLRSDLRRIGAKVVGYYESIGLGVTDFKYVITIDPARIDLVTSLWWVYMVHQDQFIIRTD